MELSAMLSSMEENLFWISSTLDVWDWNCVFTWAVNVSKLSWMLTST